MLVSSPFPPFWPLLLFFCPSVRLSLVSASSQTVPPLLQLSTCSVLSQSFFASRPCSGPLHQILPFISPDCSLETKAGGTESPELQPVFQVELLLPVVALESHQGYYFQIPMARQQFSVVVIELRSSHTPLSYTYLYTYLHTCTHTYTTHASHVTYNTCQRVWPPASTCVLHPAYPHRIPSHNNLALFLHRS
jgi:hypothetical protein